MKHEFEVRHNENSFIVSYSDLTGSQDHLHTCFEIGLILEGGMNIELQGTSWYAARGDIYVLNPFTEYTLERRAATRAQRLQVSAAWFTDRFPQMKYLAFTNFVLSGKRDPANCQAFSYLLREITQTYFSDDGLKDLLVTSMIYRLFYQLMTTLPYRLENRDDSEDTESRGYRMKKLSAYVREHYKEKILLSDFADREGLDLYYLSHYFKDSFGVTFQQYVRNIRCEEARKLLLTTDYTLLDISMHCGFSDPKYLTKGFRAVYGCTPKEFRLTHRIT